jgi:hypothetical protein
MGVNHSPSWPLDLLKPSTLVRLIQSVFVQSPLADMSRYYAGVEASDLFDGRPVGEIAASELISSPDTIFFLTGEGLSYYLPAYLMTCVQFSPQELDLLPSQMVTVLTNPSFRGKPDTDFNAWTQCVTPQQGIAIAMTLVYIVAQPQFDLQTEATIALVSHWGRYLNCDVAFQLFGST